MEPSLPGDVCFALKRKQDHIEGSLAFITLLYMLLCEKNVGWQDNLHYSLVFLSIS